jgi:hypothetical protein
VQKRSVRYVILFLSFFCFRCATAIHGRFEQVAVSSDPPGATVVVDCGAGAHAMSDTPTPVVLRRGASNCRLTFNRDGYVSTTIALKRRSSWAMAGYAVPAIVGAVVMSGASSKDNMNFCIHCSDARTFVGGIGIGSGAIGIGVDYATGAMFNHGGAIALKLEPVAELRK